MLIGVFIGILALAGALLYRARWPSRVAGLSAPLLTDDMVRQIEETGYVDVDEPLDLEQIQEEETRFWQESAWDEPEEQL